MERLAACWTHDSVLLGGCVLDMERHHDGDAEASSMQPNAMQCNAMQVLDADCSNAGRMDVSSCADHYHYHLRCIDGTIVIRVQ